MGRPTLCTPAVTKRIVDRVRKGSPFRGAVAGIIGWQTYLAWMRKSGEPYETFQSQIKAAADAAMRLLVESIREAGFERGEEKRQWQAHAWLLERRWPKLFGRRDRVQSDVTVRDKTGDEDPKTRAARLRSLAAAIESGTDDGGKG